MHPYVLSPSLTLFPWTKLTNYLKNEKITNNKRMTSLRVIYVGNKNNYSFDKEKQQIELNDVSS